CEMTCGQVARAGCRCWDSKGRIVGQAPIDRYRTPWVEPAAGGHVDGVWRLAGEDLRDRAVARVAFGHHRQECLGIWVLRIADHLAGRALLDDPAQVHD